MVLPVKPAVCRNFSVENTCLEAVFYSSLETVFLSPVAILLRIIMIVWAVWGRFRAELMELQLKAWQFAFNNKNCKSKQAIY